MEDFQTIKENLQKTAKDNGYELTENIDAIARAKLRFFGREYWAQCPCDRDSDRACINQHCKEDIAKNGVCHCNLYRRAA